MADVNPDLLSTAALLFATVAALAAASMRSGSRRATVFWVISAAGTLALAADEYYDVHERLGRELWLAGFPKLPGINHHDDMLLLLYAATGAATALHFVDEVARTGAAALLFALGGVLTVAALVFDGWVTETQRTWYIEEYLEVAACTLFASSFTLHSLVIRGLALRAPPIASSAAEPPR